MNTRTLGTATIALGASLSDAVDLTERGRVLLGIQIPAAWTGRYISFQASYDGITYVDLYDEQEEIILDPSALSAENKYFRVSYHLTIAARYLKIRAGISASPDAQAAERTIQLRLDRIL